MFPRNLNLSQYRTSGWLCYFVQIIRSDGMQPFDRTIVCVIYLIYSLGTASFCLIYPFVRNSIDLLFRIFIDLDSLRGYTINLRNPAILMKSLMKICNSPLDKQQTLATPSHYWNQYWLIIHVFSIMILFLSNTIHKWIWYFNQVVHSVRNTLLHSS